MNDITEAFLSIDESALYAMGIILGSRKIILFVHEVF